MSFDFAQRLCMLTLILFLFLNWTSLPAASTWLNYREVTKDELVSAMRRQQEQGYAIEAIGNATRLQTEIFLNLAGRASAIDPEQRPLRIGHENYFAALLEVSGLSQDSVPTYLKVAHEYGEDYFIDYKMENVLERIERGEKPIRALNIKMGWSASPGAPRSYSYEDKSTQPHVEVTHQQVTSYRILHFGRITIFDDIRGVTGRATSGLLGFIFDLLGTADAVRSKFAFAKDGVQVSRTTATKLFTITQSVTIYPDGKVLTGIAPGRPDLVQIEKMIKSFDFDARYVPFELSPVP